MNDDESANCGGATALRAAIHEGIAELDAGRGEVMSVEELMNEVRREVGLIAGVDPAS